MKVTMREMVGQALGYRTKREARLRLTKAEMAFALLCRRVKGTGVLSQKQLEKARKEVLDARAELRGWALK